MIQSTTDSIPGNTQTAPDDVVGPPSPPVTPRRRKRPKVDLSIHHPTAPDGFAKRLFNKEPLTENDQLYKYVSDEIVSPRLDQITAYLALSRKMDRLEKALGTIPDQDGTIGDDTFATIRSAPLGPQLVPPFLSPDGATILYGPGGVGKGMTAVHLIKQVTASGISVMVLDFEDHPGEWGRRSRAMGFTEEQLAMCHYRAPYSNAWTAQRGSLIDTADLIAEDCARLGVGFLVVDSYTTATSTGDNMGGKDAAQEFYEALRLIGVPSLVLAHVAGNGQRFPDKPFGSVFVHNLARETWATESIAADEAAIDPATRDVQPAIHKIELRNKKKNEGAHLGTQYLTFEHHIDGSINVIAGEPSRPSIPELTADILRRAGKAMEVKNIAAAIKAETGDTVTEAHLRSMFSKHPGRFTSTDDVPRAWTLATS